MIKTHRLTRCVFFFDGFYSSNGLWRAFLWRFFLDISNKSWIVGQKIKKSLAKSPILEYNKINREF